MILFEKDDDDDAAAAAAAEADRSDRFNNDFGTFFCGDNGRPPVVPRTLPGLEAALLLLAEVFFIDVDGVDR